MKNFQKFNPNTYRIEKRFQELMNKKDSSKVLAVSLLLTMAIVTSVGFQEADAAKAKGVSVSKYGQDTKNIVCGDMLCSETSGSSSAQSQSSQKETKTHDKEDNMTHQEEKYDFEDMTKEQIIQTIRTMMEEKTERMIQEMSNLERPEIIDKFEFMQKHMKSYHKDGAKMHDKMTEQKEMHHKKMTQVYDEMLNPNQIEFENHIGFNDLHIEAINHLIPHGDDSVLDMIVHHHCKVYDDMTAACLLFPTGMGDQDKPYGIEYVIGAEDYEKLSENEKQYWHYHKTEIPKVNATLPDLTAEQAEPLMPILNETYGKVVYFWQIGDEYPVGEPFVVVIEELYE